MKFLVDADLPKSTAGIIAEAGFEVKDVRNIGLGQSEDTEILNYAQEKRYIIITRDLGFGEMFHSRKPRTGLIILRLPFHFTAKQINKVLFEFLKSIKEEEIKRSITIIELGRYRIRKV